MTRRIELIAFYLLITAGVMVLLFAIRWWRGRKGGKFCPGNRRPWADWLFPWEWMIAGACGYDLRGTPTAADGSMTCSECGRKLRSSRSAWRSRRRFRLGATAVGLLAMAVAGYSVRPVRKGTWTKSAPTDVLLVAQRSLGHWSTRHIRIELETRFNRGEVSDRQKRWLAGAALQAIGDDYEPWNAMWAMDVLSALGDVGTRTLEDGLGSRDWQTRQLCAQKLMRRAEPRWHLDEVGPPRPYEPPDRLYAVAVEGLADDALPSGTARRWGGPQRTHTWVTNARSGYLFLAASGPRAEPFLRPAIRSDDPQQRLLAACAAGYLGLSSLANDAAIELCVNLRDDMIEGNATLAAAALFAMGELARPTVESLAQNDPTAQECRIAERILREWNGPAETAEERGVRRRLFDEWHDDPFEEVRRGRVVSVHPFPDMP